MFKQQPLEEQIEAIRAKIDAFIDERVAAIKKDCMAVPALVIRNSITRGMGCQCSAYLEMKSKEKGAT